MLKFLGSVLVLFSVLGVQCERKFVDIENIEELSAFVQSLPLLYIKRVLICSDEDTSEQIMEHRLDMFSLFSNISIEFLDVASCPEEINSDRNREKSILAVIAPKPFSDIPDSEVPTYFYEAPYFLYDLDAYTNNVRALIDWRPLKHAFSLFFEQQGWTRIAIVSDYSPYSAAFEEELVGHFKEQQLLYNVQRCVKTLDNGHYCDFSEALRFIGENEAFIVVANVDPKNALVLTKQAGIFGVTRKNGFVWLARDWPFGDIPKHNLNKISPIISLTLVPLLKESLSSQIRRKNFDGPHLASILQGLSLIEDALKDTNGNRTDHFYRDIAKHMNTAIQKDTYDSQAFIRKFDVNFDNTTVITIVVANSRFITSYNTINDFTPKVYDVRDCNIMRSNVFIAPCNDLLICGIVLVVLLFVLMFCIIIYVYIRCFAYVEPASNKTKVN